MRKAIDDDGARLLTIDQVAERLGVTSKTVRNLMNRGLIRYTRIGSAIRFRVEWVDEYIDRDSDGRKTA